MPFSRPLAPGEHTQSGALTNRVVSVEPRSVSGCDLPNVAVAERAVCAQQLFCPRCLRPKPPLLSQSAAFYVAAEETESLSLGAEIHRRSVTVTVIFRRSSPHQTQSGTDIGYTTDNRGRGYGGNSSTPQAYYALTRIMGDRLMAHTHTGDEHRQSTAHAINR